jgi:tRNA dimethylallyltransferase
VKLIAIVGPTASGKTSLAIELARRLDAEIVSADSQQCYVGLDAATAKPTPAEQARVRHHLLDVADPEHQLDAAQFVQLADAAIADIGTGLWIRALIRGLVDAPGASPEFRESIRNQPAPALHERLQTVDPESARKIRTNDRVRIERALEVHAQSGKPLSEFQKAHQFKDNRYDALTLRLEPPRELLHERIAQRTRKLIESGELARETEMLLKRGAKKALKIIGYTEWLEDPHTAEERINARTRQYAKRQRTWFARQAPPLPWPPNLDEIEKACRDFLAAQ